MITERITGGMHHTVVTQIIRECVAEIQAMRLSPAELAALEQAELAAIPGVAPIGALAHERYPGLCQAQQITRRGTCCYAVAKVFAALKTA